MTNAERILRSLDGHLDHPLELTIYGRAAIALGFDTPPPDSERSFDVDAIIPMSQLHHLINDFGFWSSIEKVNMELSADDLYITHLFQEDQVILTPDWIKKRVLLSAPIFQYLTVFRPSTIDLILTKMMRGKDPQDLSDIRFLLSVGQISRVNMEQAILTAVIPDIPEIKEAFEAAQPEVLRMTVEIAPPNSRAKTKKLKN